ncbi:MAG: signal peptide peptidase SppA [Magnetococcales bacterium]|nr:signal peptide peptidase SppA [Magnetococcales bacterium]MBF0156749.1 signal peptide peptidase SppA [Magnetococcales bacterium]
MLTLEILTQLEESRERERQALETLFLAQLKEQRRANRGKNWFRLFIALYLVVLLVLGEGVDGILGLDFDKPAGGAGGHTALVDLEGAIMAATPQSAENVIEGLKDAFKDDETRAVVIRINSPGGSAVQAGMIHDEMLRLRKKYPKIPLYAVLGDLCASGGYYVAAAAQEIYADKATLVGSIGVIMRGFGLSDLIGRLGIENRTMTAGRNKDFLDPFAPMKEEERAHVQKLLDKIHAQFIKAVKDGRGDRLKTDRGDLFEGLIWTGEEAVDLGLADGLGSDSWVAREKVKVPKMVDFTRDPDWLSRVSDQLGETLMMNLGRVEVVLR